MQNVIFYSTKAIAHGKTFADFAKDAGGEFEFEIRDMAGCKVTNARFTLEHGALALEWNGMYVHCLTDLPVLLKGYGFAKTSPEGSNSEGGNGTNAVLGNWNMYEKCFYLGISFSDWVGKNSKIPTALKSQPRTERKVQKVSKADQCLMRTEDGKNAVWNPAYLALKGINHNEFCAKNGGREAVYAELKTMTRLEWETKYGYR